MKTKVAAVKINGNYSAALRHAFELIGGIDQLNMARRSVTIKIGLFDPRFHHHTCPEALCAIVESFNQAPQIYLAESDNYCAPALPRLERFSPLYSERVRPFSLSDDPLAKTLTIAGEEMALASVLFKPNVLVSTHVLRTFSRGSILKNLFGCTPMIKKSKHHKTDIFNNLLADIFEASGGIDLAVLDATSLFHNASDKCVPVGLLIVGRDAVAVELVGAVLAGIKPEKMGFLHEFARRGLGETNLDKIEIVGISGAEFAEYKRTQKTLKKMIAAEPRGPGISDTLDCLIEEGWLDLPRTSQEVTAEILARGVGKAQKAVVETTLKRRTGKTLERIKDNGAWLFRRQQN